MKQVCGLDVHKDSVFVCILNENGVVFQRKVWGSDPGTRADARKNVGVPCGGSLHGKHEHLLDASVEGAGELRQFEAGQSILHQATSGKEE